MEERITDVENTGALPTGAESDEPARRERPSWVQDARAGLDEPGKYLAYEEAGATSWSRCRASGRGSAARWPPTCGSTTPRSHAVMRSVVSQAEGVRVLDDRSLNGIYVDGRRVEWSQLADGDEVAMAATRCTSWTRRRSVQRLLPSPP